MFFTYSQNNSGGYFKEPALHLIIEAADVDAANNIAEKYIYFDSCLYDGDCSCCGDRWYRAYKSDRVPSVFRKPLDTCSSGDFDKLWRKQYKIPQYKIIYLDGREEF